MVQVLPPISRFSPLFPVTPIVLDLTNASMLLKTQNPKFLQVQSLAAQSKKNPAGTPLATLAIRTKHLINEFKSN